MEQKELVTNRKAYHHYEILDTFEAGIVLLGTEIKSLRTQGASLQEAYVKIIDRELWMVGSSIPPYRFGNIHNHEEKRERKLLMHRKEISRLKESIHEKGLTVVPLSMYLKNGIVKLKIATAKGKKAHDKRAAIKEKEDKRRVQRAMKEHG